MSRERHVIAVFHDPDKADLAAKKLVDNGFSDSDVSLLVTDEARGKHFEISAKKTKTAEGVGFGAVIGGLVAALAAAAIPGSIFVAGPIAAALASGAAGAAGGGLVGGLVGLGIPEDEVKLVEDELGKGNIVLAAHTRDSNREASAKKLFKEAGAARVH